MQQRDGYIQWSSLHNQVLEMVPQSEPLGFHIASINSGGTVMRFNGNLMLILLGQKTFFSQVMCDGGLVVHDYGEWQFNQGTVCGALECLHILVCGLFAGQTGGPSDPHTSYARTSRSKMAGNPLNGSNGGAGIHNRSAEACLSAPVGFNSITSATTTSLPSVTVMSPPS